MARDDDDELFREWARGIPRVEFVLTERAAPLLREALADCEVGPGRIASLMKIVDMRNADGTPDKGFAPGWMVAPVDDDWPDEDWAFARLAGLPPLYFQRQYGWRGVSRFLVDRAAPAYSVFSIEPE